jgi:signal transduction histidine kinase
MIFPVTTGDLCFLTSGTISGKSMELVGLCYNGKNFDMAMRVSGFYSDGHLLSIATFRDISERRMTATQIFQTSKLATLGEMATSVAHELNQPLNVIRMAVGNSHRKISKGIADPYT